MTEETERQLKVFTRAFELVNNIKSSLPIQDQISTSETNVKVKLIERAKLDEDIYSALLLLSSSLANSFKQATIDLQDDSRESWAGTAHEIREIIAQMLRMLAEDKEIIQMTWYKKVPNTKGPTHKQRVRYILEKREGGSKETEVAEQVSELDRMLENLVRSTYTRASDAAHRYKTKKEVIRIFRYFEVFAKDILDI